ncbi:MAG: type II secretion system F family protein [Phycisphaerales bacterium JB039]
MGEWRYQTVGGASATIDAPDRASAVRELLRRGVTPSAIEPVAAGSAVAGADGAAMTGGRARGARLQVGGVSRADMASLIRELATAIHAGLPLVLALRTIARQGRSERQKAMLMSMIEQVERGRSLADAAAAQGRPFGDLIVNLINAGEVSGRLGDVLQQTAELLDRDVKLRRSLLAATLYPLILGVLITIAVIVIVTVIVPKLLDNLAGQMMTLPLPTRIVQGVAEFFHTTWWWLLPAVGLGIFGLGRLYRQPGPRLAIDRALISAPILGRLLKDVAVARFTRTLGTLTGAGIGVLQALRITRGTLNNRAMELVIDEVCDQVAGGKTIAEPMEQSGLFPPMLVQIVNLGERTGRLDELLNNAADAFDARTEQSLKLLTTALPPILVVIMASVVGFVVLAILLPLLEFQEQVAS